MEPVIKISHLSYTYPDGKHSLFDVSFELRPGEKLALIGPNGAGKSTLLYHLNGIFMGQGQIQVGGMKLNKRNLGAIRALVGVVFQNPDDQLFSPTVFDDVAYGPLYQGDEKRVVQEKVKLALAAVHMQKYADRISFHLSIGEKKRVAIATVLSMQPQILVLDEPSSGLDPQARRELIELLQEFTQTMIIATHDLDLVAHLTSRTIVLNHGKIVADGASATILSDDDLLLDNGLR